MLSSDWFSFPGLAKGSDWFAGGGVRSGDFPRLFSRNLTKWSSLDSSKEGSEEESKKFIKKKKKTTNILREKLL